MSGYVYIAQRADGRVKIGMSRRLPQRIRALSYMAGQKMTLIYTALCAEPARVERALHILHRDELVEGREWFDLSPERLASIEGLLVDTDELAMSVPQPRRSDRVLATPTMFMTKPERAKRLRDAAKILESAGVTLEARGHTGLLNDWIENGLASYLAEKLEAEGLSKAAIRYELEKLQ